MHTSKKFIKYSLKKLKSLRPWHAFVLIFFVVLLLLGLSHDGTRLGGNLRVWNSGEQRAQIIFGGNMAPFVENGELISKKLSLYEPDVFLFSSDGIHQERKSRGAVLKGLSSFANKTIAIGGDKPELGINQSYGMFRTKDVSNIFIDTGSIVQDQASCKADEGQIRFLRNAVEDRTANHYVMYMQHSLWSTEAGYGECLRSIWDKRVLPLVEGVIDVVVSADGGKFTRFDEWVSGGIRYIKSGYPNYEPLEERVQEDGRNIVSFVRITTNRGSLVIDSIEVNDESTGVDTFANSVKRYEVEVPHDELVQLYQNAPFYDHNNQSGYNIGSQDVIEYIRQPIEGVLGSKDIELSLRGNVANHWTEPKKSWNITFEDDTRQVKLIIPPDRAYINQIYASSVSEWFGVLTPEIGVAQLLINGINFGLYLEYEDADKAFVELNGFNSDAVVSKNLFPDQFQRYFIHQDLNHTTGDGQDKTYQQNISNVEYTSDNINQYFDAHHYARWLAVQIVLGDMHQGTVDNFRYVIDKPTGRYFMITWDVYLRRVDRANGYYHQTIFNRLFMENEDNASLVRRYVQDFVDAEADHSKNIGQLVDRYGPLFLSDSAAMQSRESILRELDSLKELHESNLPEIRKWLSS